MKTSLLDALSNGSKIIFIDETIFSNKTMIKKSWSSIGSNTSIVDQRSKIKTMAMIGGISLD